jgi:GT2 family glycosyltransferase
MVLPLIVSASPRDIPIVAEELAKIPCDKFLAKYHSELAAYRILKQFFLDHSEYTHMVLCPDDLIVTKRDFIIILTDVIEHNYPVIGGICNMSEQEPNIYAASYGPLPKSKGESTILPWLDEAEISHTIDPIRRVKFDGFACTFIRRDVVEKIDFAPFVLKCCFDLQFSVDLEKRGIPQYVDVRAKMLHLRGTDKAMEIKTGLQTPVTQFLKAI